MLCEQGEYKPVLSNKQQRSRDQQACPRVHLQASFTPLCAPHCSQVEAALCQHPGVAVAAVFAVPDTRMGERVAAVVVVRPGWGWQGLLLPEMQAQHAQHAEQAQVQNASNQGHTQQALHQEARQGQQTQQQQQGQQQHNTESTLSADVLCAFCRTGALGGADARGGSQTKVRVPVRLAVICPSTHQLLLCLAPAEQASQV